ncbi:MAG TPA: cytochrome b/b6 domain-containing protein [Gammaproteobacteria bacterium]|nr:cytochrome b/b6 domain-containing protein [Gammaproteobacteria bacterium]
MQKTEPKLDIPTRIFHLGLLVFGVWAWWIGEDAGDYRKPDHSGYTLHMYVGLIFTGFLALRLIWGFFGPRESRFSTWLPYTRERLAAAGADLRALFRFRMPEPVTHRGLNAVVQGLGLLLFTWQGASGTLMSILIVPGQRATGWLHDVMELHQAASVWIPTYLVLHVGAAVLHAFTGHQIWRKMIFLKD